MNQKPPSVLLGAAQVDISPSSPMLLVGMGREFTTHDGESFAYPGGDQPATEVHDPLTLQATFLRHVNDAAIVLAADLIHTVALEEVRAAVAEGCGLPVDSVFYAATHCHTGPARSDEYAALLCERATRCAREAMDTAGPVVAEHARGHFDRLSHDRAEPWGPIDGSVDVVQLFRPDKGCMVAQWWNYGCHPCSLSRDFNQISADYPGALRRRVNEAQEAALPISFFSGCTGNIQPTGLKRFSSPPQMYLGLPKGDFEMVERLGACVADAGLRALEKGARRLELSDLRYAHHRIDLPIHVELDAVGLRERRDGLAAALSEGLGGVDVAGDLEKEVRGMLLPWMDELIERGPDPKQSHGIAGGVLAMGDVAVVFTPLEVAWQIGSRIREQSPFPVTLISTTSLGFESYLTESRFYELEAEERPFETFGLQAMAGFTYTPETPAAFEQAVISELVKIRQAAA